MCLLKKRAVSGDLEGTECGGIDAMIQRAQSGVTLLPLLLASCLALLELMELLVKESLCVQG